MTEATGGDATAGNLVFIDPSSGIGIRPFEPDDRAAVVALLRELPDVDDDAAAALLDAVLDTPKAAVLVALPQREGRSEPVGVSVIRREGLANDLALVVVRPDRRRRGIGRMLLQDALRRSGKRPLTAQTPDATLPFFRACGFKLVGRRVGPTGEVRFRVGWHAPGARFKGGTSSALTGQPARLDDRQPG
jgi:GNAT superfamily N-acetyltransferase